MTLSLTATDIPAHSWEAVTCAGAADSDELRRWMCMVEHAYTPSRRLGIAGTDTDIYIWHLGQGRVLGRIPGSYATYISSLSGLLADYPMAASSVWSSLDVELFKRSNATERPVPEAVGDLLSLTGMTREEMSLALGISRRTIQNWLVGTAPSAAGRARLAELANLLGPARKWDAPVLQRWLRMGNPAPVELLTTRQWGEFRDLIVAGPRRRPVRTSSVAVHVEVGVRHDREEPDDVVDRQALLVSMRAASRAVALGAARGPRWSPPGLSEVDSR